MEKYLVKEHETGFVMIAGVLKGKVFKANDNKFKTNIENLTKDEQLFDSDFSARKHKEYLNYYR